MCLYQVTATFDPPLAEEREAYKIIERGGFLKPGMSPIRGWRTPYQPTNIKFDIWMRAKNTPIRILKRRRSEDIPGEIIWDTYISGFHVFASLPDARKAWLLEVTSQTQIVRVRVRGIRHEGIDGTSHEHSDLGLQNLVVDEMFIPSSEVQTHGGKTK